MTICWKTIGYGGGIGTILLLHMSVGTKLYNMFKAEELDGPGMFAK